MCVCVHESDVKCVDMHEGWRRAVYDTDNAEMYDIERNLLLSLPSSPHNFR